MSPTRSPARRRVVIGLVLSLVLAGCSGAAVASKGDGPDGTSAVIGGDGAAATTGTAAPTTTAFLPTTTAPPPGLRAAPAAVCPGSVDARSFRPSVVGRAPSTTEPKPSSTVTTTATTTGGSAPVTTAPITDAAGALEALRQDPRMVGATVSASVWMEGRGEVVNENADRALIPASNEKLITGVGAFALLEPDEKLHTDLVATGPVVGGVVQGDLVLIGGGDPVLTRAGPDSLDELANQVGAAGITRVEGRVLVDERRYDTVRSGQNWPADWLYSIGPMSALGVDHNMVTKDRTYVDDPAVGNGGLLKFALAGHGVEVVGGVEHGQVDVGVRVARVESPTIRKLLAIMLLYSDNFIAELLVKEIGYRATQQPGTTAAGLAAIAEVVGDLCTPGGGVTYDGSGLSRDDRRSSRELRRLLQVAAAQPWGEDFVSSLSIAGEEDALAGRLAGPATAGRLRAKGGFLFASKTLSGYLVTQAGKQVVFSILLNGEFSSPKNKAELAVDDFLTTLATLPP